MAARYSPYSWTEEEANFLLRYVTNLDLPVFALKNLPEAVKGALFARYSRTHKDLRRLLLDEFADDLAGVDVPRETQGTDSRAAGLYGTVLDEFGDDSVAQLGSAHVACEQVSNVMTKILERGRLMSYLEQSTRYVPYDVHDSSGRYRYRVPADLAPDSEAAFCAVSDKMFEAYSEVLSSVKEHLFANETRPVKVSDAVWERTIRSRALDAARGMLPASTVSNLGIHGSGQAFEHLILRLLAHPLAEARDYGDMMLAELRKVIPEFLRRVDKEEYGGKATSYRQKRSKALSDAVRQLNIGLGSVADQRASETGPQVLLLDYDQYAERRVAAAALTPYVDCSEATIRDALRGSDNKHTEMLFKALMGERTNRRHRPGRELESVNYRFEIIGDYGSYRDLQRHRILTIEAQELGTSLGYDVPEDVIDAGMADVYEQCMVDSAALNALLKDESPSCGPYSAAMAYRLRYTMSFNAREALHMIELRSQPQGHSSYRRIVQEMLRQIEDVAGHRLIGSLFRFADRGDGSAGRLEAEKRSERKRGATVAQSASQRHL